MLFSDTPRTDKIQAEGHGSVFNEVRVAWITCRTLETELHAARDALNLALRRDTACEVLMERIEELKDQNKQLAEALRCANNSFFGSPDGQKQIDAALAVIKQNEPLCDTAQDGVLPSNIKADASRL